MPKDEGMRSDSITDARSSRMQARIVRSVTGRISASCAFRVFYYLGATRLCVDVYRLNSALGSKRVQYV
jgi:hypothetical protein